ncbi:hypothetical protein M758_N022600 [Ceratodon purpureus]|nr:hypothetical protein M758_N022600 [Ceratodon purpureus]
MYLLSMSSGLRRQALIIVDCSKSSSPISIRRLSILDMVYLFKRRQRRACSFLTLLLEVLFMDCEC